MSSEQTALVPASTMASQQTQAPAVGFASATGAGVGLGGGATVASTTALTAAAATAATAAGRTAAPQGFGQVTNSKRKQASVVEMLEYVKSLDIDPIKESDLLWIAEEAFNAALPPGWSEHQDEEGRVYFHNGATGESVWRHPMDDLFKEVVEYQRSIVKNGGFHLVEDEIAELEESIRRDLADWMELFDEHGEKFFYNRRTDDSRFDDPRMAVYHNLYARIKMVAKMKERLPVLARAPRPEEPTRQEIELRRRQQEEEDRYLKCLIKVQSLVRVLVARRKYKIKVAQATIQKGPQPLRGKLRLRMEKLGDGKQKELVLAMTTPHRRNRAAMKIQARARGMLARKKFRPLVLHRAFLSKIVTKIQTRSRVWLAKRAVVRAREARVERASVDIQRVWRGHREKAYVSTLRGQKARYTHYYRCVVFIQKRARIFLEKKRLKEKYQRKFVAACLLIQKQVKVMRAKELLTQLRLEAEPIQAVFRINTEKESQGVMPWTWQMWMVPWLGRPTEAIPDGDVAGEAEEDAVFQNLFGKVTPAEYKNIAATKMQALAHGKEARNRVNQLREVAGEFFEDLFGTFWKSIDRRRYAAIKIQSLRRMYIVRREGLIAKMKLDHLGKCEEKLIFVQATFLKYVEQARLLVGMTADAKTSAAVRLQAAWRGWLARKHTDRIREEALWTMKGWFEYTATGRDACQVEVKFVPNPSFDDYKHFVAHGPPALVALDYSIEDLEDQLKMSIAHIETLLGGPLHGPSVTSQPKGDRPLSKSSSQGAKRNQLTAEQEAERSRPPSKSPEPFPPLGTSGLKTSQSEGAPPKAERSRPPSKTPEPSPPLGTSGLKTSQSEGAPPKAERSRPPSKTPEPSPPLGTSGLKTSQSEGAPPKAAPVKYGGSIVNGKFVKSFATSVDDLSEAERAAINADLEAQRQHRLTVDGSTSMMKTAESEEEMQVDGSTCMMKTAESEKEMQVVAEQAKAHKAGQAKEQAAKTRKFQAELEEAEAVEQERRKTKAKEREEKAETMKKAEQAKMESQMMHSKNSRSSPALMGQQSSRDSIGGGGGKGGLRSLDPADFEGGYADRRFDPILEGKVNGFSPPTGLPQIDQGATTPTKRRAFSHGGVVGDPLRMSRTQEAFKHPHLPALPGYQRGMEMAIGSYADSGRPQRLRGHGH